MTNSLLEIRNLSILFPNEEQNRLVVDDLSLYIHPGECLAIVGESGSGKSLTALAMMQLLPAAARVNRESQIIWKNKNILTFSEREMRHIRGRHIAMIFQDAMSALNPVLTIGQQMQEVIQLHLKLNNKKGRCRALDALEEVGISDPGFCYSAYAHQLSGGMRQRAMIAMALCAEPELLIADEPTTALDVTIQAQVLSLLKSLQKNKNMTLLFISHDLGVVSRLADDVCVLRQGQCVEAARSHDFFQTPKHPYSRQLLNAIPKAQAKESVEEHADPILKVNNLKVYFPIKKGIFKRHVGDVKAVDNVTFSIPRGKTLALVGESGSGKTTIAKAILHLINITHGDIRFNDTELSTLSNHQFNRLRSNLQIIFQDPQAALNPRMMIADSIMEGMITQHILSNREERLAEVDALLNRVGLKPQQKWRYPHEFSGGERQRICIARALALKPKLLLLDEPTSALDVSIQKQVLLLLKELQDQFNLTYLLITHDLGVVSYLAERVMVLRHGKVVEHNTAWEILNNPQHHYTKELLHAIF